jgi:hypothetical protein
LPFVGIRFFQHADAATTTSSSVVDSDKGRLAAFGNSKSNGAGAAPFKGGSANVAPVSTGAAGDRKEEGEANPEEDHKSVNVQGDCGWL